MSTNYTGPTQVGERWKSQLSIRGKAQYIGLFDTELEAARAYDNAAFAINKHLTERDRYKLNFEDTYYSGEKSPPEITERSEEIVHIFLLGHDRKKFERPIGVAHEFTLRELLTREFKTIRAQWQESQSLPSRLDHIAMELYNLGAEDIFNAWQKERPQ